MCNRQKTTAWHTRAKIYHCWQAPKATYSTHPPNSNDKLHADNYIWSSSAVTNCQKHLLQDAINALCFCLLVQACEDAILHMIQHNQMHFAAADPNMMDAHLPPQSAAHFTRMRRRRLSRHSRNCQALEAQEMPCHAEQRCRVSKHQQPSMMLIALMPMMNTNS